MVFLGDSLAQLLVTLTQLLTRTWLLSGESQLCMIICLIRRRYVFIVPGSFVDLLLVEIIHVITVLAY